MGPLNALLTTAVLLAVDTVWLLYNQNASKRMILDIQGSELKIRWLPALLVYPALATLLLQASSLQQAAIIGLATYAVYDLTNYAILTDYSLSFAIMDILWGAILFSSSYWILSKLK